MLRKVGGGYFFVHRLLIEHFVALSAELPEQAEKAQDPYSRLARGTGTHAA